jgi:hypothetical protein
MAIDHRTSKYYGGRKSRSSRKAIKGVGVLVGLAIWACNTPVSTNKKVYKPTKFDDFCAGATVTMVVIVALIASF